MSFKTISFNSSFFIEEERTSPAPSSFEYIRSTASLLIKKCSNISLCVFVSSVVRIQEVMDEVLELFMELGADDNQLDFPTVFVSALNGTSSLDPDISTQVPNMDCLFDMIINEIPAPAVDVEGGLQLQPALLDYNDYVGRIGIGRIQRGSIKVNENVVCLRADGSKTQFRVHFNKE